MSEESKNEKHWEQYRKPKEAKTETGVHKPVNNGSIRRIALSLICGSSVSAMFVFGYRKAEFSFSSEIGLFFAVIIAIQFVYNRDRIFR